MTAEGKKIADVMPRPKVIFETVMEAKLALSSDKLGVVYRRAGEVYVVTAFGSGTFTPNEWDER